MQACIIVDWLQLHVKVPSKKMEGVYGRYSITRDFRQTRHFKTIYYVRETETDEEIATLAADPHSDILSFDSGLLKINNKYLYQTDFLTWTKQFLKDLGLGFRSISRLDIAIDFQRFSRGLKPEKFIQNFAAGKYKKTGQAKGGISFKNAAGKLTFETLKFGSETSDVTYYLYNKTKEMNDVKMKPWIVDNWKANGWDGKEDVWRLEFSLKGNNKAVINRLTGEEIFTFKDIIIIDKIKDIFEYQFQKNFVFVQGKKKCRLDRMKPLLLMSGFDKLQTVKIRLSDKKQADRSDKIFAKKLMSLNQEMRGHDFEFSMFTKDLLDTFIMGRGLRVWADKRLSGYNSQYISEKMAHINQGKNNYALMLDRMERDDTFNNVVGSFMSCYC